MEVNWYMKSFDLNNRTKGQSEVILPPCNTPWRWLAGYFVDIDGCVISAGSHDGVFITGGLGGPPAEDFGKWHA